VKRSFKEVGQSSNWGCSAKEKKILSGLNGPNTEWYDEDYIVRIDLSEGPVSEFKIQGAVNLPYDCPRTYGIAHGT
jgi:hypothetical protein